MENKILKLNIGPQHPATHGVLRLIAELDGEKIKSIEPVVGYLHRGMEKMAENRTYLQYLPVVDRVDYLGGFFNSYAFCNAVEHLASISIPKRAQYIRVLTMELNRLASHLLWLGTYLLDLGATSPLFYTFRDREVILSLFEELTGQRMMYNYYIFGGVRFDVTQEWLDKVLDFVKVMPEKILDYEHLISTNPIFRSRCVDNGIIPVNQAINYSLTGPNLRACGVARDLRKDSPYLIYDELDFDVITKKSGSTYARYSARINEMKETLRIVEQCVLWLKGNNGEFSSNINQVVIKVPEGEYISNVEAPRGVCSCYLKSDGSPKPYRVKWRTGSFYAVQILSELLKDADYQDLFAIFGSLDVILPEVDR